MVAQQSIALDKNQAPLHGLGKAVLYNIDMTIGKNIAARRNELDITQDELGAACGISGQAVSQWERDESTPETDKIPLIAAKLKMPLGWPFNGPGAVGDQRLWALVNDIPQERREQAIRVLEALKAA